MAPGLGSDMMRLWQLEEYGPETATDATNQDFLVTGAVANVKSGQRASTARLGSHARGGGTAEIGPALTIPSDPYFWAIGPESLSLN
jgi:hypothetical protein